MKITQFLGLIEHKYERLRSQEQIIPRAVHLAGHYGEIRTAQEPIRMPHFLDGPVSHLINGEHDFYSM